MSDFRSIRTARRGLCLRLARDLGLHASAVYQWRRVPADRVVAVERLTGIPREVLRPDLYDTKHVSTNAEPAQ
jgi:DNA-binding transcriptional regulator YdaS (Cro superfamily)